MILLSIWLISIINPQVLFFRQNDPTVSKINNGLAKLQNSNRCSPSSLVMIFVSIAFFILIALVGNPDTKDRINIMTALLLILNSFDIVFVIIFGIILIELQVISISDIIIIGNIDGTSVLYQMYNDDSIDSDTKFLFINTNINVMNVKIIII